MIITQDNLIKKIADKSFLDVDMVKEVFRSMEEIILDSLSDTKMSEDVLIKIMNGIWLERKYIPSKNYSKGMFENLECPEHVKVKSVVSKYFDKKINNRLAN